MNVVPDVNWEKIKQEYIENCKTVKLNYLAEKYGVPPGTLRSRKNREKWDDELKGTGRKVKESPGSKESPSPKNVATKKDNATQQEEQREDVATEMSEEMAADLKASGLTEKHQLFCLYYIKCWNATKAYHQAYKCGWAVANKNAHRLLKKPYIIKEIEKLKKQIRQGIKLEAMAVLQKYIDIAFSDITDFVEFGYKEVTKKEVVGIDRDGNPIINEDTHSFNYVDFINSSQVDGTIISEVRQGKDGVAIKLVDKMKALEKLELYFDLLPDKWKRKLEEEKLEVQKKRLDIDDKDKTMKVIIVDDVPEGEA